MATPYTRQQLTNTQADLIADTIAEFTRLLQWVRIEDAEFISYWRQSGISDLTSFKSELRANRDLIGADNGQFSVYAHILRDTITRPASVLNKQITQWLQDNPDRGNAIAILLSPPQKPPIPYFNTGPKHELRQTLQLLQGSLTRLRETIVNVMRPLMNAISIDDNSEGNNKAISKPSANDEPIYKSFQELFKKQDDLKPCVDALRRITPPVINEAGRWIVGKGGKSILVAWIDRLEYCDKIHRQINRRKLVPLLNAYFPGLNMGADARIFGVTTGVYDVFKAEFAALILH